MLTTLLDRTTGPYLPLTAALRTAYGDALVEGRTFAPERAPWLALRSAKVAGDHLFLRYGRARAGGGSRG